MSSLRLMKNRIFLFYLIFAFFPVKAQENAFYFKSETSPLLGALANGNSSLASTLIEESSEINVKDKFNSTPLMYSIWFGNMDLTRQIIDKGAEVNAVNDDGNTALGYALIINNRDLINFLISKGADVNTHVEDYQSLMIWETDISETGDSYLISPKIAKAWEVRESESGELNPVYNVEIYDAISKGEAEIKSKINFRYLESNIEKLFFRLDKASEVAPLIWALKYNEIDIARLMIKKGAEPNIADKNGMTPLSIITVNNYLDKQTRKEMIRLLIKYGADPNYKYKYYSPTPLILAIENGDLDLADLFIDNGADINLESYIFETSPLRVALSGDHEDYAKSLVERGADVNVTSSRGSPLVSARNKNMIFYLLDHGAVKLNDNDTLDLEHGDLSQQLFVACSYGYTEIAKLSIDAGAQVNAMKEGSRKRLRITNEFITENGVLQSPLMVALNHDRPVIAQMLVEKGADVNAKDGLGYTPLAYEIDRINLFDNNMELLEFLIENGADMNASAGQEMPLLIYAMKKDLKTFNLSILPYNIVKTMVDHGANLENNAYYGVFPLHYAISDNDYSYSDDIALYMIEKGADIETKDRNGLTALQVAIKEHESEIASSLVQHGANLSVVDNEGNTTLLLAMMEYGDLNLIKQLIEYGADVNAGNKNGTTPLHVFDDNLDLSQFWSLQEKENIRQKIQLLLENGADIHLKDKFNASPLMYIYKYHCDSRLGFDFMRYIMSYFDDNQQKQFYNEIRNCSLMNSKEKKHARKSFKMDIASFKEHQNLE